MFRIGMKIRMIIRMIIGMIIGMIYKITGIRKITTIKETTFIETKIALNIVLNEMTER